MNLSPSACLESHPRRVSVTIYFIERNNGQDSGRERKASECVKSTKKMQVRVGGRAALYSCLLSCGQTISHAVSCVSPPSVLSSHLLLQRKAYPFASPT